MNFLFRTARGIACIGFGGILILALLFFVSLPTTSHADLKGIKHTKPTPQELLVIQHHDAITTELNNPEDFKVISSLVYFEDKNIISCIQFRGNAADGHSVMVKRKSQTVYKRTDNAWNKYCADRDVKDYTAFLTKSSSHS